MARVWGGRRGVRRELGEENNCCCCCCYCWWCCLLVMHFAESVWIGTGMAENAEALGRYCLDRRA